MEDLKLILETFGIKRLFVRSIKSGTVFIDLPIDELKVSFGNLNGCDLNALRSLKNLNLSFLEFSDITPFQDLTQLEQMRIGMHPDDGKADLSEIEVFQNLKSLEISGENQNLTEEEAKSICKIKALENLSATPEENKVNTIDFLSLPNLKTLNLGFDRSIDYGTLTITNAKDLEILLKSKYYEEKTLKILYTGSEAINPEWMRGKK